MRRFAKTFQLDDHQVLIEKDYDGDDLPIVVITTWIEDIKAIMKITFEDECPQHQYFQECNYATAKEFVILMTVKYKESNN